MEINLKKEIAEAIKEGAKPTDWRYGQFVFNYINQVYGVARTVQFNKRIDCFYNDERVDEFIAASEEVINEIIENMNSEKKAEGVEKNNSINE